MRGAVQRRPRIGLYANMLRVPAGDDDALIRSAAAGDERAFDLLVGPHVELAGRLASTMLRDRHEAEDAVQEATLKAWRHMGRLRPGSSIRAWYLTIVANQCRSVRRGRWFSLVRLADPEISSGSPEREALNRSQLAIALRRLNPTDRAAVFLRYYEDLSLEEVAQSLGLSMTAARSRVHRALRKLQVDLGEES